MAKKYNLYFVDTPRIFIMQGFIIEILGLIFLIFLWPGSSSVLIISDIISTNEDPGLGSKALQ